MPMYIRLRLRYIDQNPQTCNLFIENKRHAAATAAISVYTVPKI